LTAKGSSKIAVIRRASLGVIPAAQFLAARKKELLFLGKSLADAAHGSVHKTKFLREQFFAGLRSRKICLRAVEKVCNPGRKIFLRIG
jgi:hypothetical protein